MRKGKLTILISIIAVLAMAGSAFAAGQVVLKTTVPNIPKSTCYQAGTISMEIDNGTEMREGDIIQFTTQNKTTICKEINYYLRLTDGSGLPAGTGTYNLPVATNRPVSSLEGGDLVVTGFDANYDYGFLVRGRTDQQVVTLTLGRRVVNAAATPDVDDYDGQFIANNQAGIFTIQFNGSTDTDQWIVRIFDEKDGTSAGAFFGAFADVEGYFFKNDPATGDIDYTLGADPTTPRGSDLIDDEFYWSDNTLCIDTLTQDFTAPFVEATPDSRPTDWAGTETLFNLNFSGDYRIANILPAQQFAFATCKDGAVGNILDPEVGQTATTCSNFDFDAPGAAGYCDNHSDENKLIIQALGAPFTEGSDFRLTLEILVNGQPGERGVYFTTTKPSVQGYTSKTDACDSSLADYDAVAGTFYRADSSVATTTSGNSCTVGAGARAVRFMSGLSRLSLNEVAPFDDDHLVIDVPPLTYDSTQISNGDEVTIRVSLGQEPCGSAFQGDLTIGIFGCLEGPVTKSSLLFPYLPAANGTYFDAAFVITNLSSTAGGVTLYWFEADGDAFSGELANPLSGNTVWNSGMLPQTIANPDISWTQTAGDGEQGDAMCYVVACTEFASDGFAFVFGSPLGESMGYIPRASATTAWGGASLCK